MSSTTRHFRLQIQGWARSAQAAGVPRIHGSLAEPNGGGMFPARGDWPLEEGAMNAPMRQAHEAAEKAALPMTGIRQSYYCRPCC